jgi:hypothetical protein
MCLSWGGGGGGVFCDFLLKKIDIEKGFFMTSRTKFTKF